jgi:hypothetical protein
VKEGPGYDCSSAWTKEPSDSPASVLPRSLWYELE